MRKVIIALFILFMIYFLVMEIVTVINLIKDNNPPLWIEEIYEKGA